MSIVPPISPAATSAAADIIYPSSDGRPLAETPLHRDILVTTIEVLEKHYAHEPLTYVSGNMLVYYEKGNKRKHVSPDVFVVHGISKDKPRDYYLIWEERPLNLVVEITSKSTKDENQIDKLALYRDVIRVSEYFLFDPRGEYLEGRLKGYRLLDGQYEPIAAIGNRLPSLVLRGLEFEADGEDLRLYNPATGRWLTTEREDREAAEAAGTKAQAAATKAQAEADTARTEAAKAQGTAATAQAAAAKAQAEAEAAKAEAAAQRKRADQQQRELDRLRLDLESLKRRPRVDPTDPAQPA